MKFIPAFILCWITCMANAQTKLYLAYPYSSPQAGNEVIVSKSQQRNYSNIYYHTSTYNDIFKIPEGYDEFILPVGNFYKEKKVAKVTILSAISATPQFTIDLNPGGQVVKTTLFTELLHENQFFYDAKGRNTMVVKSYSRNDSVLRLDTIRYVHQRKVIHDTVYDYTTIYTTIYKSGAFLNGQNKWYNKTYYMKRIATDDAFHVPSIGPSPNIYLRKPLASNYTPDQFYFSCQFVDLSDYTFLFHQKPFNPGKKVLETYMPEFYMRDRPQYSDLPCEQFQEPRFMRTAMTCGSGMQRAAEYNQILMNTRYISSQNSNNLQDTCYTSYGGSKDPRYYFTYAYFE